MTRIGYRPSYLQDEGSEAPSMPSMQQHAVDGKEKESDLLTQAKNRLLDAKVFILTKAFARLSDKAKARKLLDVEFFTLLVAQLS